jgi:uncharacterized membrane protein
MWTRLLAPARIRTLLTGAVIAVAVLTVAGLAILWPRGPAPALGGAAPLRYLDATVRSVHQGSCKDLDAGGRTTCQLADAILRSGPDRGTTVSFRLFGTDFSAPTLHADDKVVLLETPSTAPDSRYAFADFQRRSPLLLLGALFVVVVVAFGRWHGVRALAGLAASLAVVTLFLLPSLLRGHSAVPVALVATSAVAFLALYLAHGLGNNTTVALVGTLISLGVITALAVAFVGATHLTGLTDEASQVLRVIADAVDPRALLIAGTVIGALGVLDDVTVTQVSAVAELREARPELGRRELYRRALRIGRDHVSSTVNTLVLAYAGASLPLLLYFSQVGQPAGRVLTREVVAVEIVRTLVGSIGLVLAVPVTTALAALASPEIAEHAPNATTPAPPDGSTGPAWEDFAPRDDP